MGWILGDVAKNLCGGGTKFRFSREFDGKNGIDGGGVVEDTSKVRLKFLSLMSPAFLPASTYENLNTGFVTLKYLDFSITSRIGLL